MNRNRLNPVAPSLNRLSPSTGPDPIRAVRKAIATRFASANADLQRLVHLALNEAEALAWDTPFPHLVFATLAEEKTHALLLWNERQRHIRRQSEEISFGE